MQAKQRKEFKDTSLSSVNLSHPDLLLWVLKPDMEGTSSIARSRNLASEPASFTLTLTPGSSGARQTIHLKTDLRPELQSDGAPSAWLNGLQMQTFRLWPKPAQFGSSR